MAVIQNYILKQSFYEVSFRIIAKLTNKLLTSASFSMNDHDASSGIQMTALRFQNYPGNFKPI